MRQRQLQGSGRNGGQVPCGKVRRAASGQQGGAHDDVGQHRFDHQAAPKRLHDGHEVRERAAIAAGIFGDGQAGHAQLGKRAPVLHGKANRLREVASALFQIIAILNKTPDAVAQHPLFFGPFKIHCVARLILLP